MFERFSQEARDAVVRADHEAADMGAGYIGCEHLLLGLLAMPGPAAGALTAAGLDLAGLRARLPGAAAGAADPLDAEALAWLGIDLDAVRRATDAVFGPGALDRASPARPGRLRLAGRRPASADFKKALELALRTTAGLRLPSISTGAMLTGIIDQKDNAALEILAAAGADIAALRADVLRRMTAVA